MKRGCTVMFAVVYAFMRAHVLALTLFTNWSSEVVFTAHAVCKQHICSLSCACLHLTLSSRGQRCHSLRVWVEDMLMLHVDTIISTQQQSGGFKNQLSLKTHRAVDHDRRTLLISEQLLYGFPGLCRSTLASWGRSSQRAWSRTEPRCWGKHWTTGLRKACWWVPPSVLTFPPARFTTALVRTTSGSEVTPKGTRGAYLCFHCTLVGRSRQNAGRKKCSAAATVLRVHIVVIVLCAWVWGDRSCFNVKLTCFSHKLNNQTNYVSLVFKTDVQPDHDRNLFL